MGLDLGSVGIKFKADTSGFDSGVNSVNKKLGDGGLMGTVAKLGGVMAGVFAGQQVLSFFSDAVSGASDLEESASKVGVVFGDAADGVKAFASTAASSMGMSEAAALEAAGTYGNLMVSLGLTGEKAADMSTDMVQLAADLGSFNNVPVDQALEAIRSGLTGETEPLKRFGVNMNEATLKAKAMELGLYDGKGALDANAKAQAAYALIMDQTKTAQGDFARTSDGLANSQKTLSATFTDMKASLGQALMPIIMEFVGFVKDNMPAIQQIFGAVGQVLAALGPIVGAILPYLTQLITWIADLVSWVTGQLPDVIAFFGELPGKIGQGLSDAWTAVSGWFSELGTKIAEFFIDCGTWLVEHGKAIITGAWDGMKEIWTTLTEWGGKIVGWVKDFFLGCGTWLLQLGKDTISGLWEGYKLIWSLVSEWGGKIVDWVKGFFLGAGKWLLELGKDTISGAWEGMKSIWSDVTTWGLGLYAKVKGFFSGAGTWLYDIGKDILNGLYNGLKWVYDHTIAPFVNTVKGVLSKFGIHFSEGPLYPVGKKLLQGLSAGMESAWPGVERQIAGYRAGLSGDFGMGGGVVASQVSGVLPGSTTNNNQRNITINVSGNSGIDIARQVVTALAGVA